MQVEALIAQKDRPYLGLLAAVPAGEGSTINNSSVQVVVPEGRNSKCIRDCCCRCFGACPQRCLCCTCHGKCVIL